MLIPEAERDGADRPLERRLAAGYGGMQSLRCIRKLIAMIDIDDYRGTSRRLPR